MSTSSDKSFSLLRDADTQKEDTKTTTSTSSEDSFCILEDVNTQEENADARTTKKEKMRKDEKKSLQSENKVKNADEREIIMSPSSSTSTSSKNSFCSSEVKDLITCIMEKVLKELKESGDKTSNAEGIIMSPLSKDSFCSKDADKQVENLDTKAIVKEKMRKDEENGLQSENEIKNVDGIIMSPSSSTLSTSTLSEDSFCFSEEEISDSNTIKIVKMRKDEQKALSTSTSSEDSSCSSEEESSDSNKSKIEKMRKDEKKSLQTEYKIRNEDGVIMSSSSSTSSTSSTSTSSEDSLSSSEEENSDSNTSITEGMQKDEKRNLQCFRQKKILDLGSWPVFHQMPNFISKAAVITAYCWNQRAIIATEDKNVYSFGISNYTGVHYYSERIEILCGKEIKTFAHNSYHVLALTEEGEVYIWKYSTHFTNKSVEVMFTLMDGLSEERVVDIACGGFHSLARTSDGKVYAWGKNNCGQIGNGSTSFDVSHLPMQVKFSSEDKNVIQIACGYEFSIVLTDTRELYGWGNGSQIPIKKIIRPISPLAQLLSDFTYSKYYAQPVEISIPKRILKVACGDLHGLALTDEGEVYAWGTNQFGQVGVAIKQKLGFCRIEEYSYPVMVKMPELVMDIAAYHKSSVAVDIYGIIYVWGDFFGQHIRTPFRTTFSKIHEAFMHISNNSSMYKPVTVFTDDYVAEDSSMLRVIEAAFDDPWTSDFTVQVEGQPIYVHKGILQIRCQYFKNLFQRDSIENNQNTSSSTVYTVPDKYSYNVYKAFLKYIYIDTIDVSLDVATELMKLADEYGEANLKKKCAQRIIYEITVSNVVFFHNKAFDYHSKELEEFCTEFILRHLKAVILSKGYRKLYMNAKDKLMWRAAKEDTFKT